MKEKREKGTIETLCKEIGFRFDKRMENAEMLIAFVSVLVSHIAEMRHIQAHLVGVGGVAPSDDSADVLKHVTDMLENYSAENMKDRAAEIHGLIHTVPCDHLIDMLSSCVSAIRFGLENPCRSRHAAAAQHIWKHVYGVNRADGFTSGWENDWAQAQFQEATFNSKSSGGCATDND